MSICLTPADALAMVEPHLAAAGQASCAWRATWSAKAFLAWRGQALHLPDLTEAREYVEHLMNLGGDAMAQREVGFLHMAAAAIWGAAESAHLALALRQTRVKPKAKPGTEWDHAARAITGLPEAWQGPFLELLAAAQGRRSARRAKVVWSASRLQAVAGALSRWARHCAAHDLPTSPTGAGLDTYGRHLRAPRTDGSTAPSVRTVACYLERIVAGFDSILEPGSAGDGALWVVEDWRERGAREAPHTKTASQVVPASVLDALGHGLMQEAREHYVHGIEAACLYRAGLMLVVGVSLPQRARALSALDLATTFRPLERPLIDVRLPGSVLKMRERRKSLEGFATVLQSAALWDGVEAYRPFRALFDDGSALFPSQIAPGHAITSAQIGRLVGNLTKERLGTRVSIHRIRDCVATEATECLVSGGALAPALLGHADAGTTQVYDHSEGLEATRAWTAHLCGRQRPRPSLVAWSDEGRRPSPQAAANAADSGGC